MHDEACPTNVNETIDFDRSIYTIVSEVRLFRKMVKQDFSLTSGQCSLLTFTCLKLTINTPERRQ